MADPQHRSIFHYIACTDGVPEKHYGDIIMSAMASQITSVSSVFSNTYSSADQSKHQISASLAFVWGNSPVTCEFPAQRASNAENVPIWWRHHDKTHTGQTFTSQWAWVKCENILSKSISRMKYIHYGDFTRAPFVLRWDEMKWDEMKDKIRSDLIRSDQIRLIYSLPFIPNIVKRWRNWWIKRKAWS